METRTRFQDGGSSSLFGVNQSKSVNYGKMGDLHVKIVDYPIYPAGGLSKERAKGRKRALVCGVSYKRQKYELKGTLNDAYRMKDFLLRRCGFSPNDIWMLTDDNPGSLPTKKNMEEGLRWLVDGCKAGDSLVFYFSGHGINQQDFADDEIDGLDESLCPVDFSTAGVILDNHLNAVLVRTLPPGVTLHTVVDACHSGTILDLPWVYNPKQKCWLDNRPPSRVNKGTSGGLAISFSACRDDQIAADTSAFSKKGMTGAMTWCFIQAIESHNFNLSYYGLITTMQEAISKARSKKFQLMLDRLLHRNFSQEILLSSSKQFDVYQTKFKL